MQDDQQGCGVRQGVSGYQPVHSRGVAIGQFQGFPAQRRARGPGPGKAGVHGLGVRILKPRGWLEPALDDWIAERVFRHGSVSQTKKMAPRLRRGPAVE